MRAEVLDRELHRWNLRPGEWWACSEPERPSDGDRFMIYDEACHRCILKAQAELLRAGDHPLWMNSESGDPDDDERSPWMLSDLAAGRVEVRANA